MHTHTLILASFLLAFSAGCKSKQEMPDASAKAGTEVPDQAAPATTAPEPAASGQKEPATTPITKDDSVFFSFERTPCFGSCPTYKVTILQDGSATYEGRRFAVREGRYTGHVDADTMKKLKEAAEAQGFYAMEDKYDKPVTDLPSVIIRVHMDDRNKQVIGRVGAPQAFKNLTKEVERLLADVEWTKQGELR